LHLIQIFKHHGSNCVKRVRCLGTSPTQHIELLPQHHNLRLKRSTRPEKVDNHPKKQSAPLSHRAATSSDSLSNGNRIGFTTGTVMKIHWIALFFLSLATVAQATELTVKVAAVHFEPIKGESQNACFVIPARIVQGRKHRRHSTHSRRNFKGKITSIWRSRKRSEGREVDQDQMLLEILDRWRRPRCRAWPRMQGLQEMWWRLLHPSSASLFKAPLSTILTW